MSAVFEEIMDRQQQRLGQMPPEQRAKVEEWQRRLEMIGSSGLACSVCGKDIEPGRPMQARLSPTDENAMEFAHQGCIPSDE